MPRNIEIKVRLNDPPAARAIALRAGARAHALERQTDRYYALDAGNRLKLRTIDGGRAELIEYRRPEVDGVRASDYTVTKVRDERAGLCLVPRGVREVGFLLPLRWYQIALRRVIERGAGVTEIVVPSAALLAMFGCILLLIRWRLKPRLG